MLDLLPEAEIPVVLAEFSPRVTFKRPARARDDGGAETGISEIVDGLFRLAPVLVGDCRPIDAVMWLKQSGWELEREEPVSQFGFRSKLMVARPQYPRQISE